MKILNIIVDYLPDLERERQGLLYKKEHGEEEAGEWEENEAIGRELEEG